MANDQTAELLAHLRRFRRRRRRQLLSWLLPMTALATVAVIEGGVVAFRASLTDTLSVLVALLIMQLVATTVIVFRRTQSLQQTAGLVDRSFALNNLTVTALEYSHDPDVISQTIVRTATNRLDHCPSAGLLPERTQRGSRMTAALAVLAIVLVVPLLGVRDKTSDIGDGLRITADVTPGGVAARNSQEMALSVRTDVAAGHPSTKTTDTSTVDARTDAVSGSPHQLGLGKSEGSPSRLDERGSRDQNDTSPEIQPGLPGNATDRQSDRSGEGASDRSGATKQAGSQPLGNGAAGWASFDGREAAAIQPREAGSVNAATTTAHAPDSVPRPSGSERQRIAAAYRAGRARSESAIAQERIPLALREYVRDYFIAIKPAVEP